MKKIEAIVEPSEVEGLKERLTGLGVGTITATEVHAFGSPGGRTLVYRGMKSKLPYATEAKIEMVLADETADSVVAVIQQAAKMDEAGESRVFVFSLDDTARLRPAQRKASQQFKAIPMQGNTMRWQSW